MEFILRKLARCIHVTFFLIIFFSSKIVYSASFTFPSTLTTNTSDFVLLSETGTNPSVSGFSTDVLITITATAGFVKITTVTGLEQINGFCGYTADILVLNLVIVQIIIDQRLVLRELKQKLIMH